jgi:DNA-binding transcriptional ArsR family regulator
LGLFLQDAEKSYYVRELTRKIGAQLNSVRRELENLKDLGLIKEEKKTAEKSSKSLAENKKYYKADPNFILFNDLKSLLNKVHILLKKNLVQEIESKGGVDYLAFTGQFTDNKDVPTDILIVGSIDHKNLQKIVSLFEGELGGEINYTLMPRDEYTYRNQVNDRFLFSILESDKIVMINKINPKG